MSKVIKGKYIIKHNIDSLRRLLSVHRSVTIKRLQTNGEGFGEGDVPPPQKET